MTYLLDTNVVSETRKRQPAPGVVGWIAATPPDLLYVSVLTLGEIGQGIARVRRRADHSQTSALEHWLQDLGGWVRGPGAPSRPPGRLRLGPAAVRPAPPGD